MTLYESTENLQLFESAGVNAYMDPELYQQLEQVGDINVDLVTNQMGDSGFQIVVGKPEDCSSGGCNGCG